MSLSLLIIFLFKSTEWEKEKRKALSEQLSSENLAIEKRILDELSRTKLENENKLENFRSSVVESLRIMKEDNEKSVEMIRTVVEEKLQGTLESKLTESFGLVSERLEQVYKGLGEMQTIAAGVGDLKKVLSNVKTRGVLGEVQLEKILEQVMAPEQYVRNFSPKGGGESVEFAVVLPGREQKEEEKIFLPIDAKFPIANYEKLIEAQEKGDKTEIEKYSKALDDDITAQSKKI
ncbi:DNA recombination protein RmuC, partial [candidate division WOR-3 bacterium]|nr:DNA recombination protein RmuC [candidate division WOR-3 bacterium]